MPNEKWNPFQDLIALHQEIFGEGGGMGMTRRGDATWTPPVDIYETEKDFVLRLELPGVGPDSIHLEHTARELTIAGEKPAHQDSARSYHWLERSSGPFERTFLLPEHVCCQEIEAKYDSGILEIVIPKKPILPTRIIAVQG